MADDKWGDEGGNMADFLVCIAVLLESWQRCLSEPRSGWPLRPVVAAPSAQGAAGLRASLSAPRVGRRDVSFKPLVRSAMAERASH